MALGLSGDFGPPDRRCIPHAQPKRSLHRQQRTGAFREVALQPKVDMQNPVLAEVVPKMFADGEYAFQPSPVDHIGIGKATLGTIDADGLLTKRRLVPHSPAMNLISFRHPLLLSSSKSCPDETMATALVQTRNYRRLKTLAF
jgi:hypothetical protein